MAGTVAIKAGERTRFAQRLLAEVGERDPRPKFVTRPDCTLAWHSENARELLRPPLPVRIDANRIKFADHIRPGGMQSFFEEACASPNCCFLRSATKGHWILLEAWPLEDRHPAIAVVCSLSVPCLSVIESGLAAELNLTRCEAHVLDLFANLLSPAQIAGELEVSIGTVRSHLKQIYSKAGLGSAVQLLQLTRGYCAN